MTRVKALLSITAVVLAAIAFAAFFPQECQRFLFNTIFTIYETKHKYFGDATHISAGALAIEDILRSAPLSKDVQQLRKEIDAFSALAPLPSGTTITEVSLRDGVKGYLVTPAGINETSSGVILYIHGGAFVAGSAVSHLAFSAELASRIKGRAFFVEYGLAPEEILPSQTNDCVLAYRWLTNSQKINPKRISLVGDSAGGGLVLLTLLALNHELRERFVPPAAAVTISAWTDLVTSPEGRPSYQKNKDKDALINKEWLLAHAAAATGTQENEYEKRKSPQFSPIYASFAGMKFPPLLMQVGTAEILLDDTLHVASKARQAGLDVTLEEFAHLQHNTALAFGFFAEAAKALESIVSFITSHTK